MSLVTPLCHYSPTRMSVQSLDLVVDASVQLRATSKGPRGQLVMLACMVGPLSSCMLHDLAMLMHVSSFPVKPEASLDFGHPRAFATTPCYFATFRAFVPIFPCTKRIMIPCNRDISSLLVSFIHGLHILPPGLLIDLGPMPKV